ncbi:MAG: hypothetical protein MN733_07715, partial [Nitrososphaera sp.]|nr:hypothetical protein [Nitrososphaera sp.]
MPIDDEHDATGKDEDPDRWLEDMLEKVRKPALDDLVPQGEDFATVGAAIDEAERHAEAAKSLAYRRANIRRAELRRSGASDEEIKAAYANEVQRQRYYARGKVPLDNVTQIDNDARWLPFANGPSSYYWLWRFKRSKDELRKILQVSVFWTAATRHRIDVAED